MQPKRCNLLVTLGRTLAHPGNQGSYERRHRIAGFFCYNWRNGEIVSVVQKDLTNSQTSLIAFHLDQITQMGQQFRRLLRVTFTRCCLA